mmetsp:Transcript_120434/g.275879  ORF Transcript_120434/g.275879 Transcript_120434/m.275879 type:complete len:207 (-) Transcript_120434:103-723(-)
MTARRTVYTVRRADDGELQLEITKRPGVTNATAAQVPLVLAAHAERNRRISRLRTWVLVVLLVLGAATVFISRRERQEIRDHVGGLQKGDEGRTTEVQQMREELARMRLAQAEARVALASHGRTIQDVAQRGVRTYQKVLELWRSVEEIKGATGKAPGTLPAVREELQTVQNELVQQADVVRKMQQWVYDQERQAQSALHRQVPSP